MMRRISLVALALILLQACGTPSDKKTDDFSELPVRKPCNLERLYEGMERGEILEDTPDMLFAKALSAGNVDEVVGLFREKKMFWDEPSAVDTPYGRFEGLDGIREFAAGFLTKFKADQNYETLKSTLEGGDYKAAFTAAHTLKGLALNMGMDALGNAASELTEALRGDSPDGEKGKTLLPAVVAEYKKVSDALAALLG